MSGAPQSLSTLSCRGRRRLAMLASGLVIAATLGIAAGSAASPVEPGSGDSVAADEGVVSPVAVPQCLAYVTSRTVGGVSVIDTITGTLTGTVPNNPALASEAYGVAVSSDGAMAYTANTGAGTLSSIDTAATGIANIWSIGGTPIGVAIAPDGGSVYVTNGDDDLVVLDTSNNLVSEIPVGRGPIWVALTPDGVTAYVTNGFDDSVSVIDTATKAVTDSIDVGARPEGVVVTPDGATAYVANYLGGTVSVIDTATDTVSKTITVGATPIRVAVSPGGAAVYVTNELDGTVSVIDTATNTVSGTITVGVNAIGVAVAPDGTFAYVTNRASDTVSVIDTATNTVIDTINVQDEPRGVAFGSCDPNRPAAPGVAVSGSGKVRAAVARAAGGGAPSSFEVIADPGGATCTVAGESGSCVVSGLDANAVYTFTAVASHAGGSSPSSSASVSVTPGSGDPARAATQFGDVSADAYYARGVDMLFQHGITTGKGSPNVYAPDEVVTRAQMATFLWRMAGEPPASACSFEDQSEIPTSARVATCWLQDNEYTTEDPYNPLGVVTRAQMAAFLFRIWGPSDGVYRESCGFSDEAEIPLWALGATCWMKDNDITTGFGDTGGYAPRVTVTRGQMAAFLYRLGGYIEDRWRVIL